MNKSDSRRLLSAAFVAVAGASLLSGCGSSELFNKYFDQSLKLLKSQSYDQAENNLLLAEKQAMKMDAGDQRRVDVWGKLALVQSLRKLPHDAEPYIEKARKEREANPKSDPKYLVQAVSETASVYEQQKQYRRALELRQIALAMQNGFSGKDSPETLSLAQKFAQANAMSGKLSEAEQLYSKLLVLEEKKFGKTSPQILNTLNEYSEVLTREKKTAEASKLKARAREMQLQLASGDAAKASPAGNPEPQW